MWFLLEATIQPTQDSLQAQKVNCLKIPIWTNEKADTNEKRPDVKEVQSTMGLDRYFIGISSVVPAQLQHT